MNRTEEPEWYRALRQNPFSRQTFAMTHIRRIEQKAEQGAIKLLHQRRRMAGWLAACAGVAAAAAIVLFAEVLPVADRDPGTANPATGQPASSGANGEISDDQREQIYYLKSDVEALERPIAYSTASKVFTGLQEVPYSVLSSEGDFVQIRSLLSSSDASGWIPAWYLRPEGEMIQAEKIAASEQIVKTTTVFSRYPDEPEPSGYELQPGKVVLVKAWYGDWMKVEFVTYDSPLFGDKWVHASRLETWDPAKAKEGFLRPGAVVYGHDGQVLEDPPTGSIFIAGEEEGRYRIGAAGGWTGLIDKADFVPGPIFNEIERIGANEEWLIRESEITHYELFRRQPSDDLLKDMSPMDIFRYYVTASWDGDFWMAYALQIQDPAYDTPDWDAVWSDIQSDRDLAERTRQAWRSKMKRYDLEQRIEGDAAVIVLTDSAGLTSEDSKLEFRLIRNRAGVWKVAWLPMQ